MPELETRQVPTSWITRTHKNCGGRLTLNTEGVWLNKNKTKWGANCYFVTCNLCGERTKPYKSLSLWLKINAIQMQYDHGS